MNQLQIQVGRIRQHWRLVATVTVLATVVATGLALAQPTVYTARAALTTSTQERAPEQDAFLSQGYAQYFNEPSYQELVAREAGLPPGVTFTAQTAATSPILFIEATSADRGVAVDAASRLATEFRDEVGGQLSAVREQTLADIQRQIDRAEQRMASLTGPSDERVILLQEIFSLESQATEIRGDTTNQLKDLQLAAGVTATSPQPVTNGLLGLVGGFIIGCLAALGLGLLDTRLSRASEIRERLGLELLADIDENDRDAIGPVKVLVNHLNRLAAGDPPVVAFASVGAFEGRSSVAEAVTRLRARQGETTLLVRADSHRPAPPGARSFGTTDLLAGGPNRRVNPIRHGRMLVLPEGTSTRDPFELFGPDRFRHLLLDAAQHASLVVVDAPGVLTATESQVVCAGAQRVVLVVERGATKASEARRACENLQRAGVELLGAVLVRPARAGRGEPRRTDVEATVSVPAYGSVIGPHQPVAPAPAPAPAVAPVEGTSTRPRSVEPVDAPMLVGAPATNGHGQIRRPSAPSSAPAPQIDRPTDGEATARLRPVGGPGAVVPTPDTPAGADPVVPPTGREAGDTTGSEGCREAPPIPAAGGGATTEDPADGRVAAGESSSDREGTDGVGGARGDDRG